MKSNGGQADTKRVVTWCATVAGEVTRVKMRRTRR